LAPKKFLIRKRKQSQLLDYLTCVGKKFGRKESLVKNFFWSKKSFVEKKFLVEKNLGKKILNKDFFGQKKNLSKKIFGP